ncbi:MAG: phosphoribosylamine--glycine ligase, partial [Anaerolineales bacterium]|nr:phosphoribosylamine--glycine ligase [Anaerolineales bacterium]
MKVLIIGSGGREHTLAWKLAQSALVNQIYVAPGNSGTQWEASEQFCAAENIDIASSDLLGLRDFAREKMIDLTVVGPEAPLADGVVDLFQEEKLPIFGPTQAAAQLESSKAFSKEFMQTFNIPTAAYATFTEYNQAMAYLAGLPADKGVVVKASGLAAGKGVIVCDNIGAAQMAVRTIMEDRAFGEAGDTLIIEERLMGPELSLLAFCDGHVAMPMVPARDHKRAYNHDQGPNTGGMGAYAPVPEITPELLQEIQEKVLQAAVNGMAKRGTPYVGVLYAGLMLTADGFKVLEFNCRFGDPETEVVLPLLQNDLAALMMACIDNRLHLEKIERREGACVTVVMASPGYPGSYPKGLPISGLTEANRMENVIVFHAGTRHNGEKIVTNGGRVLAVSALGDTLASAADRAYEGVQKITFQDAHYRTDIGR